MYHWIQEGHYYCGSENVQPKKDTIEHTAPPYSFPYVHSGSAFTVAELGEMLWRANTKKPNSFIKAYGDVFNFPGTGTVGTLGVINLMRKPDMAAKMLIYLIENGLIDQTDPL